MLNTDVPKADYGFRSKNKKDVTGLRHAEMKAAFRAFVWEELDSMTPAEGQTERYDQLCDAFHSAADILLTNTQARPRKPWISTTTLKLIDERNKLNLCIIY